MKYSLCVGLMLVPGIAAADADLGGVAVSGRFDLLPSGDLRAAAQGRSDSVDADTAYGIAADAEYGVTPNVSIGVAPRMLFNVKGADDTSSAKQLDLAVRAKGHARVAPKVDAFGYVAPGYSFLFPPDEASTQELSPKGLVLGIGAGADFAVGPTTFVTVELGYTWGWQGGTEQGIDYTLATNYLHLGVGFGAKL